MGLFYLNTRTKFQKFKSIKSRLLSCNPRPKKVPKKGHMKMNSEEFRTLLQDNSDFMRWLAEKIKKKWTAEHNKQKRNKGKKDQMGSILLDEEAGIEVDKNFHRKLPDLRSKSKENFNEDDQSSPLAGTPIVQISNICLNLERFDFGDLLSDWVSP